MTRERYESLPLATLKELAKARNMKGVSTLKKSALIDEMLKLDETEKQMQANEKAKEEVRQEMKEKKEESDIEQLDSGKTAKGIFELHQDGYGFIRSDNYLPGEQDVYVAPSQIRRFGLKTGDILTGNTRIKTQGEKFSALLYVSTINGLPPEEAMKRKNFEDLTPIFPNERIRLENPGCSTAMRVVDLISPIGKGQRGMIVSPPKAGKTTLLKEIALGILNGVVIGALVSVGAWFFAGNPWFGVVAGVAMICNMIVATLAGYFVPVILDRFHVDPALASGVFVTTCTDMFGFFAFLGLATILMSHLL